MSYRLGIEELERRIALGVKLRGAEFYRTQTYKRFAGELAKLKIREIWAT